MPVASNPHVQDDWDNPEQEESNEKKALELWSWEARRAHVAL